MSDLHFGRHETPDIVEPLGQLIAVVEPKLVVASGDLTHRGRRDQHERAAAFLRSLGPPVFAVPGNHDIPYTLPARFTRPWAEFERVWQSAEAVYTADGLYVVGLNSVRPWRNESGGLHARQLERARVLLADAPAGALRVVVLHHHLIGAPWRSRKKPVARRNDVLAALVESGAELILAGHIHQGAVSERREFEVASGGERGVVVSVAPGLGQPRPRRRGEARGLQLYEVDDASVGVSTYVWRENEWALTARRRFPRGAEPLGTEPSV